MIDENSLSKQVKVSVVITTYMRADYLIKCLEAITAQTMYPDTYEIIVVDNNSQDDTKNVVMSFIESHLKSNICYLLETQQGTSFARNCGIQAACGELICFTEDDAAPFPDWLENLVNTFNDPKVGCAGGPIVLDYEGREKPSYLQGDLQGLIGGFQLPYSEPTGVSRWTEFPWGGNMAFRKIVLCETGLFNIHLGPSGQIRLTAEETELIDRVHKKGWRIMYIPSAMVSHFVPPARLSKAHLYKVGLGLAASHVFLTSEKDDYKMMRSYMSDLWFSIRMFVKLIIAFLQRRPLWFDDYMRFWMVAMRLPIRLKNDFLEKGYLRDK